MLSSSEYEAWYAYGRLPERLHAQEFAALGERYVRGDLTVGEFEEELNAVVGL